LNVVLPPPPVITYTEPPTGTVGIVYSPLQFVATDGVPPLAWSETPALTMGLTLSSDGVLSGTPTSAGQFPIMLNVQDAVSRPATPLANIVRVSLARPTAAFSPTGSLGTPRAGHAATLLLSGKVLVTGGGNGAPDATAEVYDPATASFAPTTGNMTEARSGHTATLLKLSSASLTNYGKVLIVGSVDETAELYDPTTGTFAATGSMQHARTSPTATLLNTNKVLIAGGNTTTGDLTAELYDPTSGTFSDTGSMTAARSGHTATLLVNGQVLITGGGSATAELYDPAHGTFTATTGSMSASRSGHTATLLTAGSEAGQTGDVLIVGTDGSADLYAPTTETFTRVGSLNTALPQASAGHTASLRTDGTVLVTGGRYVRICRSPTSFVASVSKPGSAVFAPESDGFTVTGPLQTARDSHTATVLDDGSVLVIGGIDNRTFITLFPSRCVHQMAVLASAELFK
jgi:WD40 repeat protein